MNRHHPIKLALAASLVLSACKKNAADGGSAAAEPDPVAAVQTTRLRQGSISATVTAYGRVIAQPAALESLSVQYESKVVRLLVSAGEPVKEGQPLIEIEPSPDTVLQLAQATSAAESAQVTLEQVQRRFDMKLAVNQDLQQAQVEARNSAATLASLTARGADKRTTLTAAFAGLMSSIDVQSGQIVAAGSPLLSLVPSQQVEVVLGVEPGTAGRLHEGHKVRLQAVNQPGVESEATVRLVTRRVNPQTRLVDTFVAVSPDLPVPLEGFVRGDIQVEEKQALIVPRDAVLPGDSGAVVFTVHDHHAVAHKVLTGLETATDIEVSGDAIAAGDEVVTTGIYQLVDGMAVATVNP